MSDVLSLQWSLELGKRQKKVNARPALGGLLVDSSPVGFKKEASNGTMSAERSETLEIMITLPYLYGMQGPVFCTPSATVL